MVVALTGGIGTGKSAVLREFCKLPNVVGYIADEEAKKLMHSSDLIKKKVYDLFGTESYVNGQLNRDYIASIVFNDPKKLTALNAVVHPEVYRHFSAFVANHTDKIIVYESALVFETGSEQKFDVVISITAPLEKRIARVINRDHTIQAEVKKRMQRQWPEEKKLLQSHYVIVNDDFSQTKDQIKKIHNILTEKS